MAFHAEQAVKLQFYATKFSRLAQADLGKGCSTRFRELRALKRSFRKN